ncbi:response regulator transcription factor [Scrofimicrobium sp. R131]|uniref:Response regulator transcription factor n=1 Tax=Scrofimicrobium appendicitidis TaxID=3079930 RepID=A0AAU7V947_9ACTO
MKDKALIDVVVVDDHPVVRAGLRALVEAQPDLAVVAELATAEELLEWAESNRADVVLMDLRFGPGRMSGSEATRELVARRGPAVLVVTTYGTDADILAAIEAGATGYLLKDAPTEDLVAAIRLAAAGRPVWGSSVQTRLRQRDLSTVASPTERELEVLALLALGRSNEQMARELFVSQATVKTHLVHLYAKLGVQSRTAAVAKGRELGLV